MTIIRLSIVAAFASCLLAAGAPAATFTVTNQGPSGAGSLAQAVLDANAAPGLDTIAFNISGPAPYLISPSVTVPAITGPVVIDGTTQPGYVSTPLILLQGVHVLTSVGLSLQASDSTIRGLSISRWGVGIQILSNRNVIRDCYIGTDETGEDADLDKGNDNLVGIQVDNGALGTQVLDNLISANGTGIRLLASSVTLITGNTIGSNAAGTHVLGNAVGIALAGAAQVSIGDGTPGGRNVVSGNGFGIQITGASSGARIRGNFIGPNAAGTGPLIRSLPGPPPFMDTAGNFLDGIDVNVPAGNAVLIGGAGNAPAAADANLIAYNRRDGVRVEQGTSVSIRGNSIHSNAPAPPSTAAALGINLGTNAVTANDAGDGDAGPNGLQNFPILATAGSASGATVITGALNSLPGAAYRVDFYANDACDPSGNGEGQRYLGATSVATDAGGDAAIAVSLAASTTPGEQVTATATDAGGNTSESSPCIVVTTGPAVAPVALIVDDAAGAASNGNLVLEPGETVAAVPLWKNLGAGPVTLSGAASSFTGPTGPSYALPDAAADYGEIAAGSTRGCSATSDCYELHIDAVVARPSTHWDAQFTETPSTGDPPQNWSVHIGGSFADVLPLSGPARPGRAPAAGNPFYNRIEELLHSGITAGCSPTAFCPGDAVTRAQMAIFIARALLGGAAIPQSGHIGGKPYNCAAGGASLYTDVLPTDIFCRAAHYLALQNVTLGCSAVQFCPNENVTRDTMGAFIARALVAPGGGAAVPTAYGPDPGTGLSYDCGAAPNVNFSDVPATNAFCKHVHYLWALGIVAGCGGPLYCPAGLVTRDAMAKFLANAFQLAASTR
ncbi:MAG TPA: right-handed parallel beta-helix repeat-containing protein [Thermoanaerobaculia bacterium]